MKKLFAYLLLCVCTYGSIQAQFTDDFSDGDFNTNPSWQGNTDKFEVDGLQKLHLNALAESSQAYLSTPSEAIGASEWSWYCEISENPSSTNYLKVYLVSDQPQLDASLNGYFVKIGGTNDEVSLYRQDGISETMLINGIDGRVNTKPVQMYINVNRDLNGNWTLQIKPLGESTFTEEGNTFDDTYTSSAYFGVYCQYTSTRSTAFSFDDFSVSGTPIPDNTAPLLSNQVVSSSNEIKMRFSELLDVSTVMQKSNFVLNSQEPASIVYEDDTVKLTFAAEFPNAVAQQLTIKGIEDEHQNILADTSVAIFYFEKIQANWGSLVINEIFPDPTPSLLNLPDESDAEFIELYNPGPHPYDLKNWNISGKPLPEYILRADEYVILCKPEYQTEYQKYGNVLSLNSWPSLSNTGSNLILQDDDMSVIDSLSYTSTDITEGISLERIFLFSPCGGQPNFANSTHENGASPGEINTVYSDLADENGPQLMNISAISEDSLLLSFDEKTYLSSPAHKQITLNGNTTPKSVSYTSNDSSQLLLVLENELPSNVHHQILISEALDCSGNRSSQLSSSFYLDLQAPEIEQIILKDTAEILLMFSEKLMKESAEKESNYWLLPLAQSPKKAVSENDSSSVRLTFSSTLNINELLTLTIQQIEDLYGNSISSEPPASTSFTYTSDIEYVNIVNAYQLDIKLKSMPIESSALNPLNYFVDRAVGNPARVIMDKDEDGLLHLLFSSPLSPNKSHTLSISNLYAEDNTFMPTPHYHFFYDTKGPKIIDIQVIDAKTFEVYFDEFIDTTSLQNLHVWINSDTVPHTKAIGTDKSLQFMLTDALKQEAIYEIGIEGLADLQSNMSDPEQAFEFLLDQLPPQLDSAIVYAPNQLMLIFHEAVLSEIPSPEIYLEMLQPKYLPQQIKFHQLSPEKVLFTFDQEFEEEEIRFSISNFKDAQSNQIRFNTEFRFPHIIPTIGHLAPLSNQYLQLNFTSNISGLGLTIDNFSLNGNIIPDSLVFISADQIELWFAQTFNEFSQYELSFMYAAQQQSLLFQYQDFIESVAHEGKSTVNIAFSVPLNAISAEDINNYSITTLAKPIAAVYLEDIKSVHLLFDENIDEKSLHTLAIKNLKDIDEGRVPLSHHLFGKAVPPAFQEILITEIMAKPSASTSLAEAEYVEIYNASSDPIQLQGLKLADAQKSVALAETWLGAGEYLILCSPSEISDLSKFGNCLGISGFPNLNDDRDTLSILTTDGNLIYQVSYHEDWYNDTFKKEGGWSLEMIDTAWPCQERENWTASIKSAGGTPGKENSVKQSKPDLQAPELISAVAEDSVTVLLTFNEKLSTTDFKTNDFAIERRSIINVRLQKNQRQIKIDLDTPLQAATVYTCTIHSIADCSGNTQEKFSVEVVLPAKHERNEILISEILFHPRSGGVDFVELYNHSEKFISLKNWSLATLEDGQIKDKSMISTETIIIAPGDYLAVTEDKDVLLSDYPKAEKSKLWSSKDFPSLLADGGTLLLLDDKDSIMQQIDFSPDMHHPLIQEVRGVSLERISWNDDENNSEYWQSAASTAGFATPGLQNSQWHETSITTQSLEVDPPIFYPDQSGYRDFTTINFKVSSPGSLANLRIFDMHGRKVKQIAQNYSLGENGFFTWDGTDDYKKRVKTGYYIIWMEVFNPKGQSNIIKSKVAVGSRY